MNWRFLRSPYALVGAAIGGGTAAWAWLSGSAPFGGGTADRFFVFTSGWIAFSLFVLVLLYLLRKYAHKLGISPEFRMKVTIPQLEAAERRVRVLELRKRQSTAAADAELIRDARQIFREEGVHRVVKAVLDEDGRIDLRPTNPLGRTASWVEMHIHLGFWWGLVVFLHGGIALDSGMGRWLNGISAGVYVTGVIGTFFWAFGPTWLTKREKAAGISVERAWVLEQSLERKVNRLGESIGADKLAMLRSLRSDEEKRRFAAGQEGADAKDYLIFAAQREKVIAQLRSLLRVKFMINWWRLVHIPLATLLLALVIAHVIWVYRF